MSILCFAASYTVAWVLELTRLLFRSGVRGAVMVGFAAAGLLAHSLFLFNEAAEFHRAGHRGFALSSPQEWFLTAAWLLAAVYLYLTVYHQGTAFGLFLLPLVLGLVAVGRFVATDQPPPGEQASRAWGAVHGGSILLTTVAVLLGCIAGLMYLWQARRLKQKRPLPQRLRLPSLEWLRRVNSRSIVVALGTCAVSIASGLVLNLGRSYDNGPLAWHDPLVLATGGMFLWLAAASVAGWFYRPAREGHRVAYFTVASFVFLVVVLAIGMLVETRHQGLRAPGTGQADSRFGVGGPTEQRGAGRRTSPTAALAASLATRVPPRSALEPPPSPLAPGGRG